MAMARLLLLVLLSVVNHACYAHSDDAFDKLRATILTALDERRAAIQEACYLKDERRLFAPFAKDTTKGGDSTGVRGESQLSCSEAFEGERRSQMTRRLGCYGVSPEGLRFVYVQPQHTATGTVFMTIDNTPFAEGAVEPEDGLGLAWKSCHHHHPPEAWGEDADVAFVFSNNPYRRVLTSAVYQGVIPAAATTSPSQQNIRDFRATHAGFSRSKVWPI